MGCSHTTWVCVAELEDVFTTAVAPLHATLVLIVGLILCDSGQASAVRDLIIDRACHCVQIFFPPDDEIPRGVRGVNNVAFCITYKDNDIMLVIIFDLELMNRVNDVRNLVLLSKNDGKKTHKRELHSSKYV
ncbi:hypothetical protein MQA28_25835 [Escherichia coli]|nr:hypothetical protein [Escherichia coli]